MIQVDTIYQGKGIQDWKKKRGWGSIKCACLCLICHVEFFTGRSITNCSASSYATGSLRNYYDADSGNAPQPGQIIGTALQPGVVLTVTTPPNVLPLQSQMKLNIEQFQPVPVLHKLWDGVHHLSKSSKVLDRCKKIGKYVYIYICLLYTSPSPRDLARSRMPSSA